MKFLSDALICMLAGLALALLPIGAGAATVVGSGVRKAETRAVGGFHAIALGVDASVDVRQGTSEGLSITGDDNVLPLVETGVESGTLKIRWKNERDNVRPRSLAIVVDVKSLDSITVGGAGTVHAAKLSAGSFNARIGGSGDIVLDAIEAGSVHTTIGGSGRMTVAGRADDLETTIAGSGKLAAGKLAARRVKATLSGSGTATVWAGDTLQVTIAGSGEVAYYGKPKVSQTIMGSGTVKQLAESP